MYCKNCGNEVDSQAEICPHCDTDPNTGKDFCPSCGDSVADEQSYCGNCGENLKEDFTEKTNTDGYLSYSNEKSLAILCHVLGLFTGFLAPLIIYLMADYKNTFLKDHAREALNFQLTVLAAFFVSGILSILLIGILGFIVFGILNVVFSVTAALRANDMEHYKYPVSIEFVK